MNYCVYATIWMLSQKHYDNRKKAYAKDYILHDFINMKCPEKTNL